MRDEWQLVLSEDELRPGMAVRLIRPPDYPGKPELRLIVFDRIPNDIGPHGGWHTGDCPLWRTSGEGLARKMCPVVAIRERRLYRLRDLPAETETRRAKCTTSS